MQHFCRLAPARRERARAAATVHAGGRRAAATRHRVLQPGRLRPVADRERDADHRLQLPAAGLPHHREVDARRERRPVAHRRSEAARHRETKRRPLRGGQSECGAVQELCRGRAGARGRWQSVGMQQVLCPRCSRLLFSRLCKRLCCVAPLPFSCSSPLFCPCGIEPKVRFEA